MSRKPSSAGRLILTLFMLILVLSGGRMLWGSINDLLISWDALTWPTAVGHITRSDMKADSYEVRRRGGDGIRRTYNEEQYTAEIEYEFSVNDNILKGDKLTILQGGTLADRLHVQQTLDRYPVGQEVIVSYNPEDVSQCVLEPGSWGGFFVWAGLSMFLILLPSLVTWIAWHPKHSQLLSGL